MDDGHALRRQEVLVTQTPSREGVFLSPTGTAGPAIFREIRGQRAEGDQREEHKTRHKEQRRATRPHAISFALLLLCTLFFSLRLPSVLLSPEPAYAKPPLLREGVLFSGEPVSRIPYLHSFFQRFAGDDHLSGAALARGPRCPALLRGDCELPILALAPDRVFHGAPLEACPAWALTPRFQPYLAAHRCAGLPRIAAGSGGVFSVALSLGLVRSRGRSSLSFPSEDSIDLFPVAVSDYPLPPLARRGVRTFLSALLRSDRPACLENAVLFQRR